MTRDELMNNLRLMARPAHQWEHRIVAAAAIVEIERQSARITELLAANNAFEARARAAEAETREQQRTIERLTKHITEVYADAAPPVMLRPLAEYHEDMGSVLWWRVEQGAKLPAEAPWVGSPLCLGTPVRVIIATPEPMYDVQKTVHIGGWRVGYFTHFSPLPQQVVVP